MSENFLSIKLAGDVLEYRTSKDVSFRALAEATGIDKMRLYKIESGYAPSVEDLFTLCETMGKPITEYFKTKNKSNVKVNGAKKVDTSGAKTPGGKLFIGKGAEKGKKGKK